MSTEQTYLTDNNDGRYGPEVGFAPAYDFNNASVFNGGGNGHNTLSRLGVVVFNVTTEGSSSNAIASILAGTKWGTAVGSGISITYSINPSGFPTSYASVSGTTEAEDSYALLSLNATMVTAVTNSMARFAAVANIATTQLGGSTSSTVGDIRWLYTSDAGIATAYAYYPNTGPWGGDVFIGSGSASYTNPTLGSYGFHTYIHELGHAMGLKHPHDASGTVASQVNDQLKYTIMSYKDFEGDLVNNGYSSGYFPTTPMVNDILALQLLYGANTNYNTGNNTYSFTDAGTSYYYETIWDAGGTDTLSASAHTAAVVLNLNPGEWSSVGDTFWGGSGTGSPGFINNTVTIAYGAVIENAIGGAGADTLVGNSAANVFTGNNGNDNITGNGGNDTAVYRSTAASYTLGYNAGTITVQHKSAGIDGTDTLNSVEILDFTDRDLSLVTFSALHYLAANIDLLGAFGNNQGLATQHYVTNGFQENRTTTFEGQRYTASYADLIGAFGLNADIATQHYVTNGFAEGRRVTFDPFKYLAANSDLLNAWGPNTTLATQHYITNGFAEGRTTNFQGLSYIASYADLMGAFGLNADIATQHYVTNGFAEGRRVTFDPFKYLASHNDLLNAFGGNTTIATQHYITNGFGEGRQLTFSGLQYTATYGDLITAFGLNSTLSTQHYVTNGYAEGRRALFDAEFYLAKHTDLRAAFGTNTEVATRHFITNGFFEGRISTNGGADTLIGSSSADRLNGGASKDTMTGNAGADTFVFTALSDTTNNSATCDIITDFVSGLDKLDLSGIDANTDAGANEAFTSLIASGASFTAAGQLRLTDGVLYGNTNGEAGAEFAIVLTGVGAVTLADFVL